MKKFWFVIFTVSLFIDTVIAGLYSWFLVSFGVTFREIIYTIKSPLKGANNDFFRGAVKFVAPQFLVFIILLAVGVMIFFRFAKIISLDFVVSGKKGKERRIDGMISVASFQLVLTGAKESMNILCDLLSASNPTLFHPASETAFATHEASGKSDCTISLNGD